MIRSLIGAAAGRTLNRHLRERTGPGLRGALAGAALATRFGSRLGVAGLIAGAGFAAYKRSRERRRELGRVDRSPD